MHTVRRSTFSCCTVLSTVWYVTTSQSLCSRYDRTYKNQCCITCITCCHVPCGHAATTHSDEYRDAANPVLLVRANWRALVVDRASTANQLSGKERKKERRLTATGRVVAGCCLQDGRGSDAHAV